MSENLEYIIYQQCLTNKSGQFYHGYGKETEKLNDIPLNKWNSFGKDCNKVFARRMVALDDPEFIHVQILHVMFRKEETKDIVDFMKTILPISFFREGDCNKWKGVNVHHNYIDEHVSHGQFTGQNEINKLLEPFNMSYEFDYEGEARYHIQFPKSVSDMQETDRQKIFEDSLKKFMYLEALHNFLMRGMRIEILKLGKLFLDTNQVEGQPIIPSFFDEL
jgi:hypothetical protein